MITLKRVIPTYNRKRRLLQAIDSIMAQTSLFRLYVGMITLKRVFMGLNYSNSSLREFIYRKSRGGTKQAPLFLQMYSAWRSFVLRTISSAFLRNCLQQSWRNLTLPNLLPPETVPT